MAKTNSATAPVAPSAPGLVMPRREIWMDLPEEYPGWKIRVWANCPHRLWAALDNGAGIAVAEFMAACYAVILEHNGWCDEDGNPYPPANTPEFWDEVPNELAALAIVLAKKGPYELPNSLQATRRR